MFKGIDIYEGDNIQDWNVVRQQGIEVVIQKATQGTSHTDSLLQYRYPRIREAGLKLGFYHFAQFNSTDPIAEAQHFLNTIAGLESDTVLWLDIEAAEKWDKQIAINYANTFIDYIKNQGYEIGIYTGESFYNEYLEGNIPEVPLWLASYGKEPALYTKGVASWQYAEDGQLDGIVGNVDLDYFVDNIFIKGEEKELKNIVAVKNGIDKRAGEYLADSLGCPVVDLSNENVQVDYSKIENVYFVGSGGKGFPDIANSKMIYGTDRYDTCIEVLKNIGKLK